MRALWPGGIVIACQASIALVFGLAAASKVWRPGAFRQFRDSLPRSLPVTTRLAPALAIAVVLAEVMVTLCVMVPALAAGAFALAGILLLFFTGSILLMMRRDSREPCYCFGASPQPAGRLEMLRNLVVLAVAAAGLVGASKMATPGSYASWESLLMISAGCVFAILIINAREIADLAKP
ncbi:MULTISPECIES: MauE/DoxX family redox-associated membrane protein [Micromonospora]|uniref:MauE/DoxX family redox-associated membrane protein n=1 Tax=Micromonospora TaxID=1873 RepID=UPI001F516C67|nr:MauE/DoxX family redox-associated membrane protein [Micromonospora haikouensis]